MRRCEWNVHKRVMNRVFIFLLTARSQRPANNENLSGGTSQQKQLFFVRSPDRGGCRPQPAKTYAPNECEKKRLWQAHKSSSWARKSSPTKRRGCWLAYISSRKKSRAVKSEANVGERQKAHTRGGEESNDSVWKCKKIIW